MRYRTLGPSGLLVSEFCLGTMTFGGNEGQWGKIGRLEQGEADELVKIAFDAGINFFDTANVYAKGQSETIFGQALRNLGLPRDQVVVATKVYGVMGDGPNQRGASRYHIFDQAKASLRRMGLDHIDLYQIHAFDAATPIVETLGALDDLVRAGLVRYIGLSNWAAWQVVKAIGIAAARNLAPILSLQAYYTLVGRELEREIAPMLKSEGLGLMVWSPLAGGYLSGKYRSGATGSAEGRRADFDFPPVDQARGAELLAVMDPIAEAKGCSLAQLALAWLLHQEVVTSVILGARRASQLAENIAAADIRLGAEELDQLDRVSRPPAEYPAWMIARQAAHRAPFFSPGRR